MKSRGTEITMKRPMKDSVYATNKGGKIAAPKNVASGDPKATKTAGSDLRVGKKG